MTPPPSSPAAVGMDEIAGIGTSPQAARWGVAGAGGGGGDDSPLSSSGEGPSPPYRSRESTPAFPRPDPDPDGETWIPTTTWDSARMPSDPAAEDPRMVHRLGPQAEEHAEHRPEEDHLVNPRPEGHQAEDALEDHQAGTPPTNRREGVSPRTSGDGRCTSRGRSGAWSMRLGSTRSISAGVPPSPPGPRRNWTSPSSRRSS